MQYRTAGRIGVGQIDSLRHLAEVLDKADFDSWIEGLGEPRTFGELVSWRCLAKFIREKVIPLTPGGAVVAAHTETEPDHDRPPGSERP